MKMHFSQQAYGQLNQRSKEALKAVPCSCIKADKPDDDCDVCEGTGTMYEWELSPEDSLAIQDNLRSQGVPIGKDMDN